MKVEVAPDISVIIALSAVIFDICAESYVILDPDISVITPESAVKFVSVEESAFTVQVIVTPVLVVANFAESL